MWLPARRSKHQGGTPEALPTTTTTRSITPPVLPAYRGVVAHLGAPLVHPPSFLHGGFLARHRKPAPPLPTPPRPPIRPSSLFLSTTPSLAPGRPSAGRRRASSPLCPRSPRVAALHRPFPTAALPLRAARLPQPGSAPSRGCGCGLLPPYVGERLGQAEGRVSADGVQCQLGPREEAQPLQLKLHTPHNTPPHHNNQAAAAAAAARGGSSSARWQQRAAATSGSTR